MKRRRTLHTPLAHALVQGTTHPIQHVLTPTSYTHTHTSTHTAFTLSRRVSFDSAQLPPVYTIVPGNGHCCFIVVPAPNVTRLLRVRPTHIYHVCSTRPHVRYNCHTHPSHTRRHTQHYSQTHTHIHTYLSSVGLPLQHGQAFAAPFPNSARESQQWNESADSHCGVALRTLSEVQHNVRTHTQKRER